MSVSAFQASSTAQGKTFEAHVIQYFKYRGWTITGQHMRIAGAEIDLVARDRLGCEWWIECKGSEEGEAEGGNRDKSPGLERGDTVKKAVCVAAYLAHAVDSTMRRPYMLIGSHFPSQRSLSGHLLDMALELGWFQSIRTLDDEWTPTPRLFKVV